MNAKTHRLLKKMGDLCIYLNCHKKERLISNIFPYFRYIKASFSRVSCLVTMNNTRLRAVPLRSVTSKFGRTGESELTERGTGERREEEGLPSLLNQTCSGNSAHHQRRQLVKNKLICHLISNNSASICRALNPHGLLSTANVCFSSWTQIHQKKR